MSQSLAPLPLPQRQRQEASGPGWKEHFVDQERASATSSMSLAVSQSLSYIVISDFASIEERTALQDSALELQQIYLQQGNEARAFKGIVPKWVTECCRFSVTELLDTNANHASAALLQRLLQFLEFGQNDIADAALADLALQVFRVKADLQLLRVKWYNEMSPYDQISNPEPMVNIYQEGGFFKKHQDNMSLTLLVVLESAPEGGGTAFFSETKHNDSENDDNDDDNKDDNKDDVFNKKQEPERVERPPAGTAMIWGGSLTHSALPVTKGMRAVFVGSFDLVTEE